MDKAKSHGQFSWRGSSHCPNYNGRSAGWLPDDGSRATFGHTLRPSAGENGTPSGARLGMANGRRPLTLTSFKDLLEVSNIDQRVILPSRHTTVITVPFRQFIGDREFGSAPARFCERHPCQIIHKRSLYRLAWRRGLVVPNASRAWRFSILPQHVPGSSTGPYGAPSAGLSTRRR